MEEESDRGISIEHTACLLCRRFMQTFEFEIVFTIDKMYKYKGISMTKAIGSGAEAPMHNRAARSGPLIAQRRHDIRTHVLHYIEL